MSKSMDGVVYPRRKKRKFPATSVQASAAKLRKQVAILKSDDELKYFDHTDTFNSLLPSTGVLGTSWVMGIDRGTDPDQRIGRKINVFSLQCRIKFDSGIHGGPPGRTSQMFRVVIVYDKQPNGAAFTIADVLASNDMNSMRNVQYDKRFTVLHDQFHVIPETGGFQNGGMCTIYKRFKTPLLVEYDGNTAAIGDLSTGNINMFMFCNTDTSAGTNASAVAVCRVRFRG